MKIVNILAARIALQDERGRRIVLSPGEVRTLVSPIKDLDNAIARGYVRIIPEGSDSSSSPPKLSGPKPSHSTPASAIPPISPSGRELKWVTFKKKAC